MGLCGGLAEYFNIDATILRVIFVITVFFSGGTAILLYFLLGLVIPNEPIYHTGYGMRSCGPYRYEDRAWDESGDRYEDWRARREARREERAYRRQERELRREEPMEAEEGKIDEMMKEIEKKALEKEIAELKAKLAMYEKEIMKKNEKGE